MCGGYELDADPEAIVAAFRVDRTQLELPFDREKLEHFPKMQGLIVVNLRRASGGTERVLGAARWGLVPRFSKELSVGDKMYNARAESAADRPSFRDSFRLRRCLVPVSAFYEWRRENGRAQGYSFRSAKGEVLRLAGLWDTWRAQNGEKITTYTILTVEAAPIVREIHGRMPAVLTPEEADRWLARSANLSELQALLHPAAEDVLTRMQG